MKSYIVYVEASDYITVEAENDADAEAQAERIFQYDMNHDVTITIDHVEDLEDDSDYEELPELPGAPE